MSAAVAHLGEAFEAFVGSAGFEGALDAELPTATSRSPRWPCVVTRPDAVPLEIDPAFARQRLPGCVLVKGNDPEALARGAATRVVQLARGSGARVGVLAAVPDAELYRSVRGLPVLVEKGLRAAIARDARDVAARLLPAGPLGFSDGAPLVAQVLVVARTSVLVSVAAPRALSRGGWDLSPWPAGAPAVAEDRQAPSRAYRKLEEAFAWMGGGPAAGERCVDLGGSPGGWAWSALKRGASVIAVDRSPLLPPAAGHPKLEVVLGNAFTYAPPAPVDWLLCDVICEPQRTVALVEEWLRAGRCRRVIATIKFKGADGYSLLREVPGRLSGFQPSLLRIKHMVNNRNEVELMVRL